MAPAHRRQGRGRALAEARISAAAQAGAPAVVVNCIAGAGADRLYEQLGFDAIARIPDGYGPGIDMRILLRPLGRTDPRDP